MRGEDKSPEKGIIGRTLPGNRKRGRPRTACIDNVTSWTGLKLEDIMQKVENRSAWRTTIHSAAYPQTENGKKGKARAGGRTPRRGGLTHAQGPHVA